MAKFESYVQGTPNYVDVMSPDQKAAGAFYSQLFGWDLAEEPLGDSGDVYITASLDGDRVAGIAGQMPELAGHPAFWNVYLAVDDVDATTARVESAGGSVTAGPFDVGDHGRMSAIQDPTGARVNLWQATGNIGSQRANEAGAPTWNECVTPDPVRAAAFYGELLGLTTEEMDMGEMGTYRVLSNTDGHQIAGMMEPQGADHPPHWNAYFAVEDVDSAVSRVGDLGGASLVPAFEVPGIGRMAMVSDPQGAMFWVMAGGDQGQDSAAE